MVQPFHIHTPSSILVVGPSGCGKTVFTQKLLGDNLDLFETLPQSIHYCYGAWQPKFEQMRFARFHEGIPELEDLDKWFPKGQGILVLDDLMDEGSHDKRVLDLFTKHSHHRNITVLYLCQDMFPAGKYAKSISRNAHYVIAFKNPRDQLGVRNLLLQSFPTCWKECLETYQACTQEPFGYMWLDLHPASGDEERVLSHVLKDQGWTRSYQKGQGLGTPWTVAKKAEWVTRKLIPSTRHVFDRFWSGDIAKKAFAGKAGLFTKKFWTRPKKGTRIRLVKNPQTGKYENVYEEPQIQDEGEDTMDPRLKTLFEFYHRQWWTYKQRWSYFKWMYTVLNALALLLVATGMIVGPIIHNSILVAVLAAAGTFVKGWNEFKQYRHKLRMSAFAYTTYAKALNELRQSLRENNTDSLQSFIIKMTSLDDIIVDLAPPIPTRVSEAYKNKYDPCEVDNYKRPPTPYPRCQKVFSEEAHYVEESHV